MIHGRLFLFIVQYIIVAKKPQGRCCNTKRLTNWQKNRIELRQMAQRLKKIRRKTKYFFFRIKFWHADCIY